MEERGVVEREVDVIEFWGMLMEVKEDLVWDVGGKALQPPLLPLGSSESSADAKAVEVDEDCAVTEVLMGAFLDGVLPMGERQMAGEIWLEGWGGGF